VNADRSKSRVISAAGRIHKGGYMGFSGIRAVILLAVLVGLMAVVGRYDLPGWLVPLGLVLTAGVLKGAEKKAEA
jgi:hypothetical protein